MKIGVLALQGAFGSTSRCCARSASRRSRCGCRPHLDGVDGLIIPGGESTTMRRLIDRWGLRDPILALIERGAPVLGTCAGMIVLAQEIAGDEPPVLPLLDVTVAAQRLRPPAGLVRGRARRAGARRRSPSTRCSSAPRSSTRVGPGVDVLARLDDGRIVAVRERNVIATSFHPELAGETRFHRLLATMAAEHADPGEGVGRRPHPTRALGAGAVAPMATQHGQGPGGPADRPGGARRAVPAGPRRTRSGTRSLGLPVAGPRIGMFSLFRLPLGAFSPHDLLYVYEQDGQIAGLLRVERDSPRDEWTVVELDAMGDLDAGDVRFRLVQHLLRDGAKRGAIRFHVACVDADGNVELFMQAGSSGSATSGSCTASRASRCPGRWRTTRPARPGSARRSPLDAVALSRLYTSITPAPVQRLEAIRLADWERQGRESRVPRSVAGADPALCGRRGVRAGGARAAERTGRSSTRCVQIGVAKEDQPHYLKLIARPEIDAGAAHPLCAGRHRRAGGGVDPAAPGRPRAGPHLRAAARPSPGRRGVRRRWPRSPC